MIEPLDEPGIYDITDEVYFADPCPEPSLTAGVAKALLRATPMHAADAHPRLQLMDLPPEEDPDAESKFDIGRIGHSLLLGKGQGIAEILSYTKDGEISSSKNTKAWKEQSAEARALGKVPLSPAEAKRVRFMVELTRARLVMSLGFDPFVDPAQNERTMIWREGSIWCRAKADCLDFENKTIWDPKFTAGFADPKPWATVQDRQNMIALRAAHYLAGTRKLIGPGWHYRFVVVETRRPFALSIVELDGGWLETGNDQRVTAVNHWAHCLALDSWRGWAKGVVTVEAPPWGEANWVEARDNRPTEAALEMARKAQAPR
jgi:hypothetical protein